MLRANTKQSERSRQIRRQQYDRIGVEQSEVKWEKCVGEEYSKYIGVERGKLLQINNIGSLQADQNGARKLEWRD